MTGAALLLVTVLLVLACAYLPGFLAIRALSGSRPLALALAPALSLAAAGIGAMAAAALGLPWNLGVFGAVAAVLVASAAGLGRLGVRLPELAPAGASAPADAPDRGDAPVGTLSRRARLAWAAALLGGLGVAVGPIAVRAGRADAVLERYDTLYHLTALQHIRLTGDGSSLTLNSIASSSGRAASYPAAFHDLASLVPAVPVPILLNGAVLALAVVPWTLGTALLARSLFPQVPWAAPAAALAALLIPASPLDLWIHLSPIPNLVGFAVLPGALAAACELWRALALGEAPGRLGAVIAALSAIALAGIGMMLLHPNAAVTALILLAVMTGVTALPLRRTRPWLLVVPVLSLLPIALLAYTPLGARVTGFSGGLQVPLWSALGEVVLGLLTVWPMFLGVVIAALWWPGLIAVARTPQRWAAVAWLVIAVLYLDAAVDSPLNLSVLYFRGQDRLAMPLAMLCAVLVVPGLRAYADLLRAAVDIRAAHRRPLSAVLVLLAVAAALASIPPRLDSAAKNLDPDYPGRGRFLQADELRAFAQAAPHLDRSRTILASPYSGAAHMYALHGLPAHFPVAGVALTTADRAAIDAVAHAGSSPAACRDLVDLGIGYVYQENRLYQYDPAFTPISHGGEDLGEVVLETEHSRLIRIDCDPGR